MPARTVKERVKALVGAEIDPDADWSRVKYGWLIPVVWPADRRPPYPAVFVSDDTTLLTTRPASDFTDVTPMAPPSWGLLDEMP